jgi:hypothetical protein
MERNFRPIFGFNNICLGYATEGYDLYGEPPGEDISPELTKRILHDSNLFIPAEVESWPFGPVRVRYGVCPIQYVINHAKLMNLAYKVQPRGSKWGVKVDEYEMSRDRVYFPFTWARYGQLVNPITEDGVGKDGVVRDAPVPKRESDSKLRLRI